MNTLVTEIFKEFPKENLPIKEFCAKETYQMNSNEIFIIKDGFAYIEGIDTIIELLHANDIVGIIKPEKLIFTKRTSVYVIKQHSFNFNSYANLINDYLIENTIQYRNRLELLALPVIDRIDLGLKELCKRFCQKDKYEPLGFTCDVLARYFQTATESFIRMRRELIKFSK